MKEIHIDSPVGFDESLLASSEPFVIRGLGALISLFDHCDQDPHALLNYIESSCNSTKLAMLEAPARFGGKVGYRDDDPRRLNFDRTRVNTATFFKRLRAAAAFEQAPLISLQSTKVEDFFYDLLPQLTLSFWEDVSPRIWIGNRTKVPAHVDDAQNIALCLAGRRRFTLLPPQQIANLYVGPVDFTPSGAAISLADPNQPDLEKYPRLAAALEASKSVELMPGDAIYIPPMWWHQVEALDSISVLVNYWRGGSINQSSGFTPFVAMYLAMLSLKGRSDVDKHAWRSFFEHYVFGDSANISAHIQSEVQGILADEDEETIDRKITEILVKMSQK